MNTKSNSYISSICTIVAVVYLIIRISFDTVAKGLTIAQIFLDDPIGYLTTFIPFIAGLISRILEITSEGYKGSLLFGYVIKAAIYFVFILLMFWVVLHFPMITGVKIQVTPDFLVGLLLLLLIPLAGAAVLCWLDGNSISENYLEKMLPMALAILALANGCMQAGVYIPYYPDESTFTWIGMAIVCGGLYMIWLPCYLLLAIPIKLVKGF